MPSTARCVYCRQRPVDPHVRPFCSERCKMADLGRWLNGTYAVAGQPAPEIDLPADAFDDTVADGGWRR